MSDLAAAKELGISVAGFWTLRQSYAIPSFSKLTGQKTSRKTGEVLAEGTNSHHSNHLQQDFWESIDSELKAYFFGLLAADGHLANTRKGRFFMIELQQPDGLVLNHLREAIGETRPLAALTRPGKKPTYRLNIYSRQMVNDLLAKGFTYDTTTHALYRDCPKEYRRHMLRGLMDGDGHIDAVHRNYVMQTSSNPIRNRVVAWINEAFELNCSARRRTLPSGKPFYSITFKHQAHDVLGWMYQNARYYIPRKKEQVDILLSRY